MSPSPGGGQSVVRQVLTNPVYAVTVLSAMMVGTYVSSTGSLIVILARDFGMSRTSFTMVASGFGISNILIGLVGKKLLRHVGAVRLLVYSAALATIGYIGILLAPGYWLSLGAAFCAATAASCSVLVSPFVFKGHEGVKVLSFSSGMASLAGVISPLVYGAFDGAAGMSGRVAVLFGFVYLVPMVIVGTRHERRRANESRRSGEDEQWTLADAPPQPNPPELPQPGPLLSQPAKVKILFASCLARQWLAMFNEYLVYAWAATRLVQLGFAPSAASMGAALFPLGMMVGRVFGAPLTRLRAMMQVCTVLICAGGLGVVFMPSGILVMASYFVCGLGVSLTYPMAMASITSIRDIDPATATTIATSNGGFAIILGPAIAAYVGASWGIDTAFGLMLASAALLFVLPGRLRR